MFSNEYLFIYILKKVNVKFLIQGVLNNSLIDFFYYKQYQSNYNHTCAISLWLFGWQEMHCRKKATVAFSMAVLCWVVSPLLRLVDPRENDAPEAWDEALACEVLGDGLCPALVLLLVLEAPLALEWHRRNSSAVQSGLTSGPPSQSFMVWLFPTSVKNRNTGAASSGDSGGLFNDAGEVWLCVYGRLSACPENPEGKGRSPLTRRLQQRSAKLRTSREGKPESNSCWMALGDWDAAARVTSWHSERETGTVMGARACLESSVRDAALFRSCCFLPSSVIAMRRCAFVWATGGATMPIQDMRREK